ncbi:NAD-dependent protein deacetylase of SIR2 family [Olavius sp. associated proteobacterium Delta 1]|nr:NAD-dependent protein deacetylase of SIR2 family [Olavius sp. associated proteobacterium Delta 1]
MKEKIAQIAARIKEGGNNIVFTGAGISTESGIPDYRSQGGIWDKFRPVYFDEFMSSKAARAKYWRRWVELYQGIVDAQPNPAHLALTKLHENGLLRAVVTQNVDGLHQESGLPDEKIIELHGNTRRIRCMSCRQIIPTENVHQRITAGDPAPQCECGGYLKPDTISFGQSMPVAEVEKAAALSQESDFFMIVGSTVIVQPAANMPFYAKNNGAFLAIINLSETPCDEMCDALIREKAGMVLPEIVKEVEKI